MSRRMSSGRREVSRGSLRRPLPMAAKTSLRPADAGCGTAITSRGNGPGRRLGVTTPHGQPPSIRSTGDAACWTLEMGYERILREPDFVLHDNQGSENMATDNIRYWGFRIDNRAQAFFRDELMDGRLRMGWGYEGQDLRGDKSALHAGTRRNLRALREVKQGHILVVPYLPEWHLVAIVEATEDWDQSYRFDIPQKFGDYGHIFPAKLVKRFSREAAAVTGNLRAALRVRSRFWSMDRLREDIDTLCHIEEEELDKSITDEGRLKDAIRDAFDEEEFGKAVYENLNKEFDNTRWENVLVKVLQTLYPAPCEVTRVGGKSEKSHGTDILVSLPGVGDGPPHVIAVQVKDWGGSAGNYPVDQIGKAAWWENESDYHVIEKVVILTKVHRGENSPLVEYADKQNVRLVFSDDLKKLLTQYAKRTLGLDSTD